VVTGRLATFVERLLSPIADMRQGEATSALLMALTISDPRRLTTSSNTCGSCSSSRRGAEVKSYSSASQAMLLLGLVPAYGAFIAAKSNSCD
jgi:AAA family ATP:ADP antiporter